jgi:cardiolipin synthase
VGSTTLDARSFSVNDEANLNVHDRGFAADLERSRRVTLEECLDREAVGEDARAIRFAALGKTGYS